MSALQPIICILTDPYQLTRWAQDELSRKQSTYPRTLIKNSSNMVAEHGRQADCAAWRIIASTKQKGKTESNERTTAYMREHAAEVEAELRKIRDGILALMKVLCFLMKGDNCRCLAEFATRDAKSEAAEDACVANAEASKVQIIERVVEVPQVQYQEVIRYVTVPQVVTQKVVKQVPVPQPFVQSNTWL